MFLRFHFRHFKKKKERKKERKKYLPRYRYRSEVNIKKDVGNFVGSDAV